MRRVTQAWQKIQKQMEEKQKKLREQAISELFCEANKIFQSSSDSTTQLEQLKRIFQELEPIIGNKKKRR